MIWRGHAGFKLHVGERRPAWTTRPYSEDIRERALAWADGVHSCRVTKWNNRGERPEAFRPARSEATRRRFCLAHTPTGCAFARGHSPCASWRGSWQRVESRQTVGRRGPSFTMRGWVSKKTIRQAEQIVPISPVNAHAGRPIKAGLTLRALRQFRRKMVYRARRCVRDLVVMLQRGGAAPECRFAKKSLLARIMLLQAAGAA